MCMGLGEGIFFGGGLLDSNTHHILNARNAAGHAAPALDHYKDKI